VTTSDVTRPYLSIGEVLALLLEEFPDVTISKIRFLESQGLIDPERTPSGYRKFYEHDVERLKVILREQRENFLPLRVIRDRLENGQIDDSGPLAVPRGIRNVLIGDDTSEIDVPDTAEMPTRHHPAAANRAAPLAPVPNVSTVAAPVGGEVIAGLQEAPSLVEVMAAMPAGQSDVIEQISVHELCRRTGLSSTQLDELESFGLLAARGRGPDAVYSAAELSVATAAAGFLRHGVEARHLRAWRQAADREVALFEQLVLPLLRQRNPQARQQATGLLSELSHLGAALRRGMVDTSLSQHYNL
jgi:DNA-binding transcriptional MerR regulator